MVRLASLDRNAMHVITHEPAGWQLLGSRPHGERAQLPGSTMPGGAWNRAKPRARTWVWSDLDPQCVYLIWFDAQAWRWEAQDVNTSQPVRTRVATNRRSRWTGDRDSAAASHGAPNAEASPGVAAGAPSGPTEHGDDPRKRRIADR